jgi:hypothetical protein
LIKLNEEWIIKDLSPTIMMYQVLGVLSDGSPVRIPSKGIEPYDSKFIIYLQQ